MIAAPPAAPTAIPAIAPVDKESEPDEDDESKAVGLAEMVMVATEPF
jgi:hypothetical protein